MIVVPWCFQGKMLANSSPTAFLSTSHSCSYVSGKGLSKVTANSDCTSSRTGKRLIFTSGSPSLYPSRARWRRCSPKCSERLRRASVCSSLSNDNAEGASEADKSERRPVTSAFRSSMASSSAEPNSLEEIQSLSVSISPDASISTSSAGTPRHTSKSERMPKALMTDITPEPRNLAAAQSASRPSCRQSSMKIALARASTAHWPGSIATFSPASKALEMASPLAAFKRASNIFVEASAMSDVMQGMTEARSDSWKPSVKGKQSSASVGQPYLVYSFCSCC
mmetsp:Transcript_2243/g.6667  ORF Transcript_2243/g.6667 Transcript_2243/m.6667 type:complete len:281 (-) Transcript_2243:3660-4502(-)